MQNFKFVKEKDRWYIDLPTWTGSKEDLEMVCGADTLCDILSQGEQEVTTLMSLERIGTPSFVLLLMIEDSNGATYSVMSEYYDFDIWLCNVTKFVFGEFPKVIYLY